MPKGRDTIAQAWSNTEDHDEALYNWTKIIILAAREKRCCCTRDECVAILAERGIVKTSNAIRTAGHKRRISSRTEMRFYAGQNRRVSLFDPEEVVKYYTRSRRRHYRRRKK